MELTLNDFRAIIGQQEIEKYELMVKWKEAEENILKLTNQVNACFREIDSLKEQNGKLVQPNSNAQLSNRSLARSSRKR